MKTIRHIFQTVAMVCLLCSCANEDAIDRTLPLQLTLNEGAGRGDWLFQTLRLEDGTELLFIVDTGAPLTYLDKSLEPRLGKPLGDHVVYGYYGVTRGHQYRAPKLFLGGMRLRTDPEVVTVDFQWLSDVVNCSTGSNRQIMGILGMDCLGHYCIQLDFAAGKFQFLDPRSLNTAELGKAFPLVLSPGAGGQPRPFVHENLLGMQGQMTLIDTGCPNDGQLGVKLFHEATNRWATFTSTNTTKPCMTVTNKVSANFSFGQFGGESYPDLHITGNNDDNTIGLRFLARHLVTFDFPKQTMYLKRVSAGPLAQENGKTIPKTALEPAANAP